MLLGTLGSVIEAKDKDTYMKPSNLDPRKTVIYERNKNGRDKQIGYLKPSVLDSRKIIIYDKDGKENGFLEKSKINPKIIIIKDK